MANQVSSFLSISLDNLMRQRMDGELEQLRSNMHRILSEQQQEFAQAFGLSDEQSSSEVNHCKKNPALLHLQVHPCQVEGSRFIVQTTPGEI